MISGRMEKDFVCGSRDEPSIEAMRLGINSGHVAGMSSPKRGTACSSEQIGMVQDQDQSQEACIVGLRGSWSSAGGGRAPHGSEKDSVSF